MNSGCNEGLSFFSPKWKKKSNSLGYMEIFVQRKHFRLYAWETIGALLLPAKSHHKLIWISSESKHLLSICGRNPRWKVPTLWLGQKGKSWALAGLTNEALNSGCGTALYNDFCWTLAVKSSFLWRKFLNLKPIEHFWFPCSKYW